MADYKQEMEKFIQSMEQSMKTELTYLAFLRGEMTAKEYQVRCEKEINRLVKKYEETL